MRPSRLFAPFLAALLIAVPVAGAESSDSLPPIADSPESVQPIQVGAKAPDARLLDTNGGRVSLAAQYAAGPVVLVFYRGGWCPYCEKHLSHLQEAEAPLRDLGIRLIAVSPDLPAFGKALIEKTRVGYSVLGDPKVEAARAFGLAFALDADTLKKYKGYGIDLNKHSGETHNALPVPAVILVDETGTVRFVHADPDYTKRLSNEALLEAARAWQAVKE
jgi:peroxiredoxin